MQLAWVLDVRVLGEAGVAAATCPDPAAREVLELAGATPVLVVWNKCDLCTPSVFPPRWIQGQTCCTTSAFSDTQVEDMAEGLRALLLAGGGGASAEEGRAPNARQSMAMEAAQAEPGGRAGRYGCRADV